MLGKIAKNISQLAARDPEALHKKRGISITFTPLEEKNIVFASSLLKEHIYNLINNSLDAITDSIKNKRIEKGIITITMRKEKVEDATKK